MKTSSPRNFRIRTGNAVLKAVPCPHSRRRESEDEPQGTPQASQNGFVDPVGLQAFRHLPPPFYFKSSVPLPPDPMTREIRWSVTSLK